MSKLLALDLFCGGGGACIGMQWAGFEVVGIDIKPHRNYPGHFIQADIHERKPTCRYTRLSHLCGHHHRAKRFQ